MAINIGLPMKKKYMSDKIIVSAEVTTKDILIENHGRVKRLCIGNEESEVHAEIVSFDFIKKHSQFQRIQDAIARGNPITVTISW